MQNLSCNTSQPSSCQILARGKTLSRLHLRVKEILRRENSRVTNYLGLFLRYLQISDAGSSCFVAHQRWSATG